MQDDVEEGRPVPSVHCVLESHHLRSTAMSSKLPDMDLARRVAVQFTPPDTAIAIEFQ